jgi:hypothetical protein
LAQWPGIKHRCALPTLRTTATAAANDTANGGTNYAGGYGFIDAHLAVAALPAAPAITASLSPTSVNTEVSSTYTWSVTNATGCTASGAWSGAQALSGSMMVSQSATGTYDYTLTCVNASGKAASTQVRRSPVAGGSGAAVVVGGGGAPWTCWRCWRSAPGRRAARTGAALVTILPPALLQAARPQRTASASLVHSPCHPGPCGHPSPRPPVVGTVLRPA